MGVSASGRDAKFSRIVIDRPLFESAVVQGRILVDEIENDSLARYSRQWPGLRYNLRC